MDRHPLSAAASVDPQVRLFGHLRLCLGADERLLLPQRHAQLLGCLAGHGDWMRRDQLAAWLWPAHRQAAARVNLRNLLLRVRRQLAEAGAPALEEHGDALRWPVSTDLQAFRRTLAAGDWAAALALAPGELLQGIEPDDDGGLDEWLRHLRIEVAHGWRHAGMEQLAKLQGQPRERAALAQRMLERDPLDEEALLARLQGLIDMGQSDRARSEAHAHARLLRDEWGLAPSARIDDLWRSAADTTTDATQALAPAPALPRGEFVGRLEEQLTLRRCLADPGCRLLSLVGPGGMGKSTLVAAMLPTLASTYPDGVHWLRAEDLSGVTEVAASLSARVKAPSADAATLGRQLGAQRQLWVLDGAEHLAAAHGLGDWLAGVLAEAAGLQVLVTTRRRLGVPCEQVMSLDGMALPAKAGPTAAQVADGDAVALFAARARRADARFDLRAHAEAVRRIVRATEGLPLAIELAASWVGTLAPTRIAELLEDADGDALQLVGESSADGTVGLRDSVRRSWTLLSPRMQQVAVRLAWLPGSFTAEMAQGVLALPLPALRALAQASLLRTDVHGRFVMHALVAAALREFGADEREAVRRRHAGWVARRAEEVRQRRGDAYDHMMNQEWHHLDAAWDWAAAARDPDAMEPLVTLVRDHYVLSARTSDGVARTRTVLADWPADGPHRPVRARLLLALSDLLARAGELETARLAAREALVLARAGRHTRLLIVVAHVMGMIAFRQDRPGAARRYWEESLKLTIAVQDRASESVALNALGVLAMREGRDAEARPLLEKALAIDRAEGAPATTIAFRVLNLGIMCMAGGLHEEARRYLEEALRLSRAHGVANVLTSALHTLAQAHALTGDLDRAQVLADEAVTAAEVTGQPYEHGLAMLTVARVAHLAGAVERGRQALIDALGAALDRGDEGLVVLGLLNAAEWLMRPDPAEAAAVAVLLSDHPGVWASERARAPAVLARCAGDAGARRRAAERAAAWDGQVMRAAAQVLGHLRATGALPAGGSLAAGAPSASLDAADKR